MDTKFHVPETLVLPTEPSGMIHNTKVYHEQHWSTTIFKLTEGYSYKISIWTVKPFGIDHYRDLTTHFKKVVNITINASLYCLFSLDFYIELGWATLKPRSHLYCNLLTWDKATKYQYWQWDLKFDCIWYCTQHRVKITLWCSTVLFISLDCNMN